MSKMVSVVIPTLNSARTVGKLLDSLRNQDFKDYEVIVVDGGSTDETLMIAEKYPARIVKEKRAGIGAARRTGVLESTGVYVAFIDSDCRATGDWLRSLVSVMTDIVGSNMAGVGGSALPEDESLVSKCLAYRFFVEGGNDLREVDSIATFNAIYRKDVITKAGNFDPELSVGEELELNHRIRLLGFKLVYAPKISVFHSHPITIRQLLKKWFNYGVWFAKVQTMTGNFVRSIVPRLAYFLCLVSSIILFCSNLFFIPLAVFLLPSIVYVRTAIRAFKQTGSFRILILLPLIHNLKLQAHTLGVVSHFLTGAPRRTLTQSK